MTAGRRQVRAEGRWQQLLGWGPTAPAACHLCCSSVRLCPLDCSGPFCPLPARLPACLPAYPPTYLPAGRAVIERHLADNTLLQNYTAVLEILLRLRQVRAACCARYACCMQSATVSQPAC